MQTLAYFGIVEHVNYDMSAVIFQNSTHEQRVICPMGKVWLFSRISPLASGYDLIQI